MHVIFVFRIWYYFIKKGSPNCVRSLRTWISPAVGFHDGGETGSCVCTCICHYFSGYSVSLAMPPLYLEPTDMLPSATEAWDRDLESLPLVPPGPRGSHKWLSHFPVIIYFSMMLWLQSQPSPTLLPIQWSPSHLVRLHNRLPGS